jgi:Zn finger protein HypA/HybF involved in hydrogenase expression
MSDDDFKKMVETSISIGDICQKLTARKGGSVFSNIKHRIKTMDLNTDHFINGRVGKYNPSYVSREEFIQRIVEKKPMELAWLKKKLIEFSIIPNKCNDCKIENSWNGKPLTLQLDHIDGDFTNNVIDNLRLLCPNCHSQTPTFSMGKRIKNKYVCLDCGCETSGYSDRCHMCSHKKKRKVIHPTKEELEKLVKSTPMTKIGSAFGVTDNAVRKWCKVMNINYKSIPEF